jgi:hypothetical protein
LFSQQRAYKTPKIEVSYERLQMANRKKSFPHIKDGVRYDMMKMGNQIHVTAEDGDRLSSASFEPDQAAGMFVASEGSVDLHPEHAKMGVGQTMGKLVNQRYMRHFDNWKP